MFAPGTTRAQLTEAAERIVAKGTRMGDPSRRMQAFQDVIKVNGRKDLVRVIVDSADKNRVVTIFPVITGNPNGL